MDKKHIEDFAKIPQIPQEKWGFIDDIKSPLTYVFDDSRACDAKENSNCRLYKRQYSKTAFLLRAAAFSFQSAAGRV